jgi:hypothetical protein
MRYRWTQCILAAVCLDKDKVGVLAVFLAATRNALKNCLLWPDTGGIVHDLKTEYLSSKNIKH